MAAGKRHGTTRRAPSMRRRRPSPRATTVCCSSWPRARGRRTPRFKSSGDSYSLKQGIEDGFLAPYKVVKVHIDKDVEGYRPEPGKLDRDGNAVEDRIYNQKDFDRTFVIDERTALVARKITDFLKQSEDRFQKTIVFCVDTEHASRMRQAFVNANPDLCAQYPRYVMRITGNDTEDWINSTPSSIRNHAFR